MMAKTKIVHSGFLWLSSEIKGSRVRKQMWLGCTKNEGKFTSSYKKSVKIGSLTEISTERMFFQI